LRNTPFYKTLPRYPVLNALLLYVILHQNSDRKSNKKTKAMNSKSIKIKGILFLVGAIILNSAMTSCSSGKNFTGRMKYTYYKKVKAQGHKDTALAVTNTKQIQENHTETQLACSSLKNNVDTVCNTVKKESINNIDTISENSALAKTSVKNDKNEIKTAGNPTTTNKITRIYNKKFNRTLGSGTNTQSSKTSVGNIILKILLGILLLIVAIILVILIIAFIVWIISIVVEIGSGLVDVLFGCLPGIAFGD
jgi:hypothetical protein